ncbi:hypothetical protein GQ43DRAFT_250689 [Delitschia confertaspora ATCC 74209]|uniref:Uncharacterized protein n=1 Tax=Delitschia confertaspora ATCC 74209 TaxID=1513339 RepID=A0A9P4JE20_9PLEO|nr:hypothetical protein GQ43DRAFT_250689 [Delitschia confertaspora ATCC 74209]
MARRGHNDTFEGEDGPVTGPVSLARLVAAKNAPKRNRGNRTWRPLELSDLGEDEDGGIAMDSEKQDPAPKATPKLTEVEPFPALTPARATLSDLARIQTDFTMAPPASSKNPFTDSPDSPGEPELQRFPFPRVPRNDSYDASPTGARDAGAEEIHKVFGLLPDPFHLEQCTGENDGAVVFIGHPNRDVSAHQWSASAFQWVNIGLYSYTRRQIEGSLSKDRLKGQTIVKSITPNTLAYFKEVALQRQKTAEEDTRRAPLGTQDSSCQARNPQGLDFPWMEPTPQQAFREIYDIFYPPRNENQEALFGLQESQTAVFGLNPGPRPARRSLAIDDDDPFVSTPTKAHQAAGDMYNMSRNAYGEMDALDCGQKASSKLAGNHVHCLNDGSRNVDVNTQLYFQQEVEENQEDTKLQPRKLGPEDIQGGGETNKNTFTRPQAPLSPEDQHQRQKLIEKMANYPIPPAVPPYPPTRPSDADIRPVFATKMTGYEADIENSDSTTPESLKVSDPDGIAQPLVPQIAPGLKGLHPTQQNFKGPFFADSMPTTHDPTASLTFRDDEERKLRNWFTDGQRPARQEDFYKTMMSADAKAARTSRDFGAIGKPSPQALSRATDNTRIFIPLYETLQQYADEAQTGNRSYFTRAWIKPAAHLIDHGPDGNNSFFGLTSSVSVPRPMAPSRRLTAGFGLPIGTGFSVAGARDTRSPFIFPRNGN